MLYSNHYNYQILVAPIISFVVNLTVTMSVTLGHGLQTTANSDLLLDTLCQQITCSNGECYLVGNTPKCTCNEMYSGVNCDIVNLNKVEFIVLGSMVIFKWPHPPLIKGYSFLFYRMDDPLLYLNVRKISMYDHESSALVGNLRDGVTKYRICVEKDTVAQHAFVVQSMEHITNCVSVMTRPDYHTVFAWFLAACGCVIAVLLVYWQRDKIELLYFNRAITINNGVYNYNVDELIRLEKERKQQEREYLIEQEPTPYQQLEEDASSIRVDKCGGTHNKRGVTLETMEEENWSN